MPTSRPRAGTPSPRRASYGTRAPEARADEAIPRRGQAVRVAGVPDSPTRARVDRSRVRTGVVWDVLRSVLEQRDTSLDVLDAGGGTGGFAVPLAERGHQVTVVDPSPDALAALGRRVAE